LSNRFGELVTSLEVLVSFFGDGDFVFLVARVALFGDSSVVLVSSPFVVVASSSSA